MLVIIQMIRMRRSALAERQDGLLEESVTLDEEGITDTYGFFCDIFDLVSYWLRRSILYGKIESFLRIIKDQMESPSPDHQFPPSLRVISYSFSCIGIRR